MTSTKAWPGTAANIRRRRRVCDFSSDEGSPTRVVKARTGEKTPPVVDLDDDDEEVPTSKNAAAHVPSPSLVTETVAKIARPPQSPDGITSQELDHQSSGFRSSERLESLVEMGFIPGVARKALAATKGDMGEAIERCLREVKDRPAHKKAGRAAVAQTRGNVVSGARTRSSSMKEHCPKRITKRHRRSGSESEEEWNDDDDNSDEDASEVVEEDSEFSSGMDDDFEEGQRNLNAAKARMVRNLRSVASSAEDALLADLSGDPSDAKQRVTRVEVRKTIRKGCTALKTDFWGLDKSEDLRAKSPAFDLLKEHQRVGVRWLLALHKRNLGAILADEMGLGKTAQTLCFLEQLQSSKPSLVVAPASLIETWEAEAARWTPSLQLLRYHAANQEERYAIGQSFLRGANAGCNLIITTVGVIHNRADRANFFRKVNFEYLVCDEAHHVKNSESGRHQDLLRGIKVKRRLLLTGTPIQNSLSELVNLLGFCLYEQGSALSEELRCIAEEPQDKALARLQTAAAPLVLRRLKADVLSDLPKKHGVVLRVDLEPAQRAQYDTVLSNCRKNCFKGKIKIGILKDAFFKLRRVCLHPLMGKHRLSEEQHRRFICKITQARSDFQKASIQRVEQHVQAWSDYEIHQACLDAGIGGEFLVTSQEILSGAKITKLLELLQRRREEDGPNAKTLVFSQFTQYLDVIEAALTLKNVRYMRLDGNTALEVRQKMVTSFNRSESDEAPHVFLISMKAGGVGLNLSGANVVVFMDLDFNPMNNRQAEDRVHRLGQTKPVTVYYITCAGTVEEGVVNANMRKMNLDLHFGGQVSAFERAVDEKSNQERTVEIERVEEPAETAKAMEKKVEQQVLQDLKDQLLSNAS